MLEEFYADGFLDETRKQHCHNIKNTKDEVEGDDSIATNTSLESSTSADENNDSGESLCNGLKRLNKPRRARTYHGTADSQSKFFFILLIKFSKNFF